MDGSGGIIEQGERVNSMFQHSIRNKLILLLLLITVIPFGASIFLTYYHTTETLKTQSIHENMNLLSQGKLNLEFYIAELDKLTQNIYNNPDFFTFLRTNYKETDYDAMGTVKSVLLTLLYTDENIVQVYLYSQNDRKMIHASKTSTVIVSRNIDIQGSYYDEAFNSPNRLYIEPTHGIRRYSSIYNHPSGNQPVISVHRALINVPNDDLLGYFSIDIKPNRILEMSRRIYHSGQEEFYLLNPEGEMIYGSNMNVPIDQWLEEPWFQSILDNSEVKGYVEKNNDEFNGVIIYDRVSESLGGWILVKRIPYEVLYKGAREVTKINISIGIMILILVVVFTLFVSFKITSPIRVLLRNIQRIEEGKMGVDFDSLGRDEIGLLGKRFKSMIEKIDNLIIKQYRLDIENKNNQLKVLQSQINPHFLYNTLQSIGTLALKHKVPQVYSLITLLSKIMRYGIHHSEEMVPLIKEINHAKAYVQLQKQRFENQFEYTFHVDEKIQFAKVPKMILQPLIENYFQHGFDVREGIGRLEIHCSEVEGNIEIRVIDNGTGVSEERLQLIRRYLIDEEILDESIGLKNSVSKNSIVL